MCGKMREKGRKELEKEGMERRYGTKERKGKGWKKMEENEVGEKN